MNIFLIGFMGSGKSSVGKRLAKKLNFDFVDMDSELEKEKKMHIHEIFNKLGEIEFRKLESDWLKNITIKNTVIALGGGTPCFNNNMEIINASGISVYLMLSIDALTNRLYHSKNTRPLIAEIKEDKIALKQYIEEELNKRNEDYLKAKIKFEAENISSEKLNLLVQVLSPLL